MRACTPLLLLEQPSSTHSHGWLLSTQRQVHSNIECVQGNYISSHARVFSHASSHLIRYPRLIYDFTFLKNQMYLAGRGRYRNNLCHAKEVPAGGTHTDKLGRGDATPRIGTPSRNSIPLDSKVEGHQSSSGGTCGGGQDQSSISHSVVMWWSQRWRVQHQSA